MIEYSKEFTIPYYDCNKLGYVKPVALLEYLVETSSLHSDDIGSGLEDLTKEDYGWILSRWKVKLYNYPRAREKIQIQTWASDFEKFYANREFKIYDESNNLILKASTLWIFMSLKRKRPIRIPKNVIDSFNYKSEKNFDEFFKFEDDFKDNISMDFRVRKTDIDYNNHVNNAKYLNWILEPIPLDIDENYVLDEFDIYYKKEIKYEHIIESKLSRKEIKNDDIVYFHEIYNKNTGELATEARSIWKKPK